MALGSTQIYPIPEYVGVRENENANFAAKKSTLQMS